MGTTPAAHKRGRLTLYNELPLNHPRRHAVDTAVRSAFAELPGSWKVVLQLSRGPSLVVVVFAPDHSAWFIRCCNPEEWNPASLAGTVRAVCSRRGWIKSVGDTQDTVRRSKAAGKVAGRSAASTPAPAPRRIAAPGRGDRGTPKARRRARRK